MFTPTIRIWRQIGKKCDVWVCWIQIGAAEVLKHLNKFELFSNYINKTEYEGKRKMTKSL
jgi:hypothetical protein